MEPANDDRPYRRRVLQGTLATMVGNGWAMAVGILTLPLLLNGLGIEAFGVWALLQTFSVATGWLSLGDFGLTTSTVRFVATQSAEGRNDMTARVAGTSLALFATLGVAWGGMLGLFGPAVLPELFQVPEDLRNDFRVATYWFSLQVVADFAFLGIVSLFEGAQRVDRSRVLEMARRTLVTGGAAAAAVAGLGLGGVALASFAGTLISLAVAGVTLHRNRELRLSRPDSASAHLLMRFGGKVALLRPLGVLHRTMDRIVVGIVLGPSAVGLVEIATQIQSGSAAVLGASSYAVTPSAAWLGARGDRHRLLELVEVGTRYTLLATLPVVVASALLAGPAVAVWVGTDYAAAAPLVVLAVTYIAVVAPLQVGCNLLVGTGLVVPVLRASVLSLTVNLGFSLILVRSLETTGVFIATILSAIVLIPLLGRGILGAIDVAPGAFIRSAVVPPAAAASVMAAAVAIPVALPLPPWPTIVSGLLTGTIAFLWAAPRLALHAGELRGLVRGLRTPRPVPA